MDWGLKGEEQQVFDKHCLYLSPAKFSLEINRENLTRLRKRKSSLFFDTGHKVDKVSTLIPYEKLAVPPKASSVFTVRWSSRADNKFFKPYTPTSKVQVVDVFFIFPLVKAVKSFSRKMEKKKRYFTFLRGFHFSPSPSFFFLFSP